MTLGALLSIATTGVATPVKIPSAQVLTSRLGGFEHFIEKTNFVKNVADKELEPLGVAVSIETALFDYAEYMKAVPNMETVMEMNKPMIFEACLKDHPEALAELEGHGLYKPIGK